jgi:hypothetical protein
MTFMVRRKDRNAGEGAQMIVARFLPGVVLIAALGGCISVKAPDKPIEINLNVNVRQEVVVRLQRDADQFINQNPELFPQ